jgi:hypothetical protein
VTSPPTLLSAARLALLSLAGMLTLSASSPASSSSREAQLADLRIAETQYVARSGAFSGERLAAAKAMLADLRRRAGTLDDDAFLTAMMRLAALADNGHDFTFLDMPASKAKPRLPMLLLWFPDGLTVIRAGGAARDLAGARVTGIEGLSPQAFYARARALYGGADAMRKMQLAFGLGQHGVLRAMGIASKADSLRMAFRTRDGRSVTRRIAFVPQASLGPLPEPQQLWFPLATARANGWTQALPALRAPLSLREADRWFRAASIPALHASYVEFRTNFTEGGQDIGAFIRATRARLAAEKPEYIIVDHRFNLGGDVQTTLSFMRDLPRLASRHVYVLIGPYTFSAGIVSVAALKKAGGGKVTLVGAPVGDRMRFWSEGGRPTCLPNAHICFVPRTGMFDLAHGCAGEAGCYGDRWNVNIGSLDPEISAPFLAEAYVAGRDPGMEAVRADIERRRAERRTG